MLRGAPTIFPRAEVGYIVAGKVRMDCHPNRQGLHMTGVNITPPDDLTGTADERIRQLELLAGTALSAQWLRR